MVSFENGLNWIDRPDVYGLDPDRLLIEVEIKTSLADFGNEFKKKKYYFRNKWKGYIWPGYFYFLVPADMADHVKANVDHHVGVLTVPREDDIGIRNGLPILKSIKKARRHEQARKLPLADCLRMVSLTSSTIVHLAEKQARALLPWNQPTISDAPYKPTIEFQATDSDDEDLWNLDEEDKAV